MFRFARRMFRPFSRTAALLLLWEHRKSAAMAVRSVRHEVDNSRRTGRWDLGRWKALVTGLWSSRQAAERGTVKTLIVDDGQRVVPLATSPTTTPHADAAARDWIASDPRLQYSNVG